MKDNPHNKSILCPRCGYDLRGIIQTWQTTGACPLKGKCSECGLDFNWQRVFRESEHPWLFEYHWRRKPIRSFFITLWHSAFPWKFWHELDLFWEVRIIPLLMMLVMVAIITFLICYGMYIERGFWYWHEKEVFLRRPYDYSYYELFKDSIHDFARNLKYAPAMVIPLIWAIVIPTIFYLLRDSLKSARVRFVHLLRISCYSIMFIIPCMLMFHTITANYFYYQFDNIMAFINHAIEPLGRPVIWILRKVFLNRGVTQVDSPIFAWAIIFGFFFIPYWWWACSRYLKINAPMIVMSAVAIVSTLFIITLTMAYGLVW